MKKGWKYRLLSGVSAMLLAGAIPMASYADEENTTFPILTLTGPL